MRDQTNLITSTRVETVGGHDHVTAWNRGGSAGLLVVRLGDGQAIAERLEREPDAAPPECRQCHECSQPAPSRSLPCHPIAECNEDGVPVFACKHCERVTPWLDDDELERRRA